MDTVYFSTMRQPLDVDDSAILSEGITLADSRVLDCSQNYTGGTANLVQFFLHGGI